MAWAPSGPIEVSYFMMNFAGGFATPRSFSDMYRGGTFIPATRFVSQGYWQTTYTGTTPYYYSGSDYASSPNGFGVPERYYWNGVLVATAFGSSVEAGGYLYEAGTVQNSGQSVLEWNVRRSTITETWVDTSYTQQINTNVPANGQISLSQMRGVVAS